MENAHIVGGVHSFTYNACNSRYQTEFAFNSYSHPGLVEELLNKKIPITDTSIVPLWNSNAGTVDMDKKTRTINIFQGQAGNIVDLWPERIAFELGVMGNGELSEEGDVYSVEIAQEQCSSFLRNGTDRFEGAPTTTDAAVLFMDNAQDGDGLLCSNELLSENGIDSSGDRANPNNFTVFATINTLPVRPEPCAHIYSLACVVVDLSGDKLPMDFINYWQELFSEHEAELANDILSEIPKIMFIIRHDESKALLLLEMPSADFSENPWPVPDIDADFGLEVRSELLSCEQVGGIHRSYVATEKSLFLDEFRVNENDIVFYGSDGTFLWGVPALNVFVQGYDPALVKDCARLQVKWLVQLRNYGIDMPDTAKELLDRFEEDEENLRLSPTAQPDTV